MIFLIFTVRQKVLKKHKILKKKFDILHEKSGY